MDFYRKDQWEFLQKNPIKQLKFLASLFGRMNELTTAETLLKSMRKRTTHG